MSGEAGEAYRELMRRRPRPTDDQIWDFAEFVADDHSWYKKLPFDGKGEPFVLYLSPHIHEALIDTDDGGRAWRAIIRTGDETSMFTAWALDLQPGDVDPELGGALVRYAEGMSTENRHAYLGHWSYWNFGRPDEPRDVSIRNAVDRLRVTDDDGVDLPLPAEVVDLGLVYLRATVSPNMGPSSDEYEALRVEKGLPSADDDRVAQLDEMVAAMRRVADWVYGPGSSSLA